jgi:hypothetical protein
MRKFIMAFDSEYYFFRKHRNFLEAVSLRLLSWTLIALIASKRFLTGRSRSAPVE